MAEPMLPELWQGHFCAPLRCFSGEEWLGKAGQSSLLPLFAHVPWHSCRGRLARGGLLHQLSQWHMGLWL